MKVAVAGHAEGTRIPHFGHAELFTIFDCSEDQPRLLEVRSNRPHCDEEGGDRLDLDQTVMLIGDCVAVLASKIGPCARDALMGQEIVPLEYEIQDLDGVPALLERLKVRLHAYARRRAAGR